MLTLETAAPPSSPVPSTSTERLAAVDLLRGVAMVLMALDHAMSLAHATPVAESYGRVRPELVPLPYILIGLLTNISSGIFFVLAGTSVAFFEASRLRRGWAQWQITHFLLIRAAILFVLDMLVEPSVWNTPIALDVLSAIAFCLVTLALVRRLPLRVLVIGAAVLFFVYPLLVETVHLPETTPLGYVTTILLHYHLQSPPRVEFPLLSRQSLVMFGYAFGVLLGQNRFSISDRLIRVGIGGLVVTLVLRLAGGYGNFLPYEPGLPFVYFFIENKQPPSIVFLLFNLSLAVLLLVWLNRSQALLNRLRISPVLTLFGQTSLFFYVAHLMLYSKVISKLFSLQFLPIAGVSALFQFAIGIVLMVPLCALYRSLRRKYPDSMLQYL